MSTSSNSACSCIAEGPSRRDCQRGRAQDAATSGRSVARRKGCSAPLASLGGGVAADGGERREGRGVAGLGARDISRRADMQSTAACRSSTSTMALLQLPCLLAVAVAAASAALPDYIPVCSSNDPDINACVANAIEKLRPTLMKGIPELEVPPIDPLEVSQVTVSPVPGQRVRVTASNIKVYGLEKTRINRINVDVRNQEFSGAVEIPNLMFDADYNVDAKFMQLSMKGKGAVTGNATDCRGDFVLRGKLVKRKGGNYLQFNKLSLSFNVERSHSHLEGLVSGDLVIGDAVYEQGENSFNVWPLAKPVIERSIAEVLLEMANRIASHVTYDEMFP